MWLLSLSYYFLSTRRPVFLHNISLLTIVSECPFLANHPLEPIHPYQVSLVKSGELTRPYCFYTLVKVAVATPKRWLVVRGHDKPISGSCTIYFPGGIQEINSCWKKSEMHMKKTCIAMYSWSPLLHRHHLPWNRNHLDHFPVFGDLLRSIPIINIRIGHGAYSFARLADPRLWQEVCVVSKIHWMDRGTDVKVRQTLLNRCVILLKFFLYMFMMFVRLGGFQKVDVR